MSYRTNPPDQEKMISLKELRQKKGLSGLEMADRLGMSVERYYDAENGKPPTWMKKAIKFFDVVFEDGYLPSNIKLAEKPTKYKTNQQ